MILYMLSGMWAVGTLALLAYLIFIDDVVCESWVGRTILGLLGIPVWAFLGCGPLFVVHESLGPELASLSEAEWQCASSHRETHTNMVMVGKVLVPQTTTSDVCDAYTRKEARK